MFVYSAKDNVDAFDVGNGEAPIFRPLLDVVHG